MIKHAAFALSLFLCASAFGAEEPQWLKEARAREAKSLKPTEIKSKDGWFTVTTPGKLVGTVELVQGSYSVELDVGGDAHVNCEVYPKGVDLANTLRSTLDNALDNIEELQGKLEVHALESSDAGAHGAAPFLAMNWLYRVATDKGAMLGGLKQFVMEKGRHAVYCAHNDLGYTRTFAAITKAFADSLQTQEAATAPQYVEIHSASVAGAKVGIAVVTFEKDSDGDTKAKQMISMLIAMRDSPAQSQDMTHVEWVRPDGTLINAASSGVVNGELSTDLAFKQDDDIWTVEGEVEGKAIKAVLPKDADPGNLILQARQLRTLLAQPDAVGREHSIRIWDPETPEALTLATTKVLSRQGADRFATLAKVGEATANLTLDKATGMPTVAEMQFGPLEIKTERVYVSGSF